VLIERNLKAGNRTGRESYLARTMAKFKVYPLQQLVRDLDVSGGALETFCGGGGTCPSKGSIVFRVNVTFLSALPSRHVSCQNSKSLDVQGQGVEIRDWALGSASGVGRPRGRGCAAVWTPLDSGSRWKLAASPLVTSGWRFRCHSRAERRARSARVMWRGGGGILGLHRSSCAIWRASTGLDPGYRSYIANCRAA